MRFTRRQGFLYTFWLITDFGFIIFIINLIKSAKVTFEKFDLSLLTVIDGIKYNGGRC